MTTNLNRLVQVGFEPAGKWILEARGLGLDLSKPMAEQRDVLYAFAVDGTVSYIGKTALSLRERMQQYKTPARSAKNGASTVDARIICKYARIIANNESGAKPCPVWLSHK